jgi:hypothetical protein
MRAAIVFCLALAACDRQPTTPIRERTVAAFQPYLTKQLTRLEAQRQFGPPDEETGSGLRIYVYRLDDNRELWLGFPGDAAITYARVKSADGSMTDLTLRSLIDE